MTALLIFFAGFAVGGSVATVAICAVIVSRSLAIEQNGGAE